MAHLVLRIFLIFSISFSSNTALVWSALALELKNEILENIEKNLKSN